MNGIEHRDVAIVGSGFSGLGMAIRLEQAGRRDYVVLEQADALGGTWRDNHYPGCACDVPAPLYSFSFAPNPGWSRLYAGHEEIRDYMERCADRYGVRPRLRLGARVTGAEWDDHAQRWTVEVDGRAALTARVLVAGIGGLSRPALPDIEGLERFRGPVFHSAAWDHDVDLRGKRVAVVGTGASAIQLVPRVAKVAAAVDVFMRTPPWVLPKIDRRFSGLERRLFGALPVAQRLLRGAIFAIQEAVALPITRATRLLAPLEAVGRAHLRRQVPAPELRRRLTPDYRLGCKRILLANDFYPALTRDNVEVVSQGIARVSERGLVTASGQEREADVLVLATGFAIEEAFMSQSIRGRDGVDLRDVWAQDGIQAHRGTTVSGFPNLMLLSGPNTGTGSTSQVFMIESQLRYVMEALALMDRRGAAAVEPRAQAQADYNAELQQRMAGTVWLQGGCKSWYLDSQGRNRTLYPGFSSQFARSTRHFRESEHLLEPVRHPDPRQPVAA